jgi:hypothetical protein
MEDAESFCAPPAAIGRAASFCASAGMLFLQKIYGWSAMVIEAWPECPSREAGRFPLS